MDSKSVAIVINDISSSGGTERIASFLANKLSSLGVSVTLVSIVERGQPFYLLNSSVVVSYVGSDSLYKLGSHIKKINCDSVISISMGRLSFQLSILFFLFRIKSKLILSEHVGYESSSFLICLLKRISYYLADQLVLLTNHDLNILKPVVSTPIAVIPNPTLYKALSESELSKKKKIVLAVGRLNQQKNFKKLIELWSALPEGLRQDWKLRIVGSGEEKELLLKVISEVDVKNSVDLVPASKEIHLEYKQASILAMTSRYEGLPLVLIEAKSFGLPAIAFNCKTGPSEIINDGIDGFLISVNDDKNYTAMLQKLMKDDALRLRMATEAISKSNDFSENEIIKKWLDLI
ncbi:glycosyltransferase family 4 protein [Vibrio cholerae]|uniref:glycosyltransferase family 4 protein n=5 Tax=Vibrio cholerae TaxID=666 RepID=UPI0018F0FB4F|nr:glycosyltransferase family 4 protein [Vibrio cholerae]MBJ6895121.1 glycosyltransferase family 4 protein [Vibrio cholerae]MBJ6898912.1 glycosyltransferase family 4 protein [Vibrio cholerae]MBJ6902511.1 glycosyltransferase family 4 protein [Vibrio cholerae]